MIHDILLLALGALLSTWFNLRKHRRDNLKAMREELDAVLVELDRFDSGGYSPSAEIIAAIEAMHRERTNAGPV